MSSQLRILLIIISFLGLFGCQIKPYGHVQVSRSYPQGACYEIGQVIGNADTRDGAREQAMNDLRYQAAQREGDYVRLIAETASGSSMRGIAYKCR